MLIDHVTYEIPLPSLRHPSLTAFMELLGFKEKEVDKTLTAGFDARWFVANEGAQVHLVGGNSIPLGLGHFCIRNLKPERIEKIYCSPWCDRHHSEKRLWLTGPGGLRVEVRI